MTIEIVSGVIQGRVVPHVRVGRERFTERAKRYRSDQDRIEWLVRLAFSKAGVRSAGRPWRLEVRAYFAPAKKTGEIPLTCGDIDNIAKSVADALQRSGCTPDDAWMHDLVARKRECPTKGDERVEWVVRWNTEAEQAGRAA